ncbi:efflux RND transporter periplasmic adaptor subunit [Roseiconus lacunae]|uniref:Efflux RND transporter periplasmic adaptor subunit n=1 Tax=Roseiconus lacunae TaxID=2605694 RepID=A0ABT7PPL5_9BACT|nr:efflux RND transporter periplasmic adaptor subunit [Roseiconus lacunae]MDM4018251.1 efflux RND transporter periplasmic adaptor subunit [Roseiconus lacunae]
MKSIPQHIQTTISGMAIIIAIAGCGGSQREASPIRPVRTVQVGDLTAISGREFPGRAVAKDDVELSFQVSGPLVALPVDVGTVVKKGDVIAAIDPRDFETALASNQAILERAKANLAAMQSGARPEEIEQLEAALAQAEASKEQAIAEHERNERLIKNQAVSKTDFDISLARTKRTKAEVESAQEALNIGMAGARPEDIQAKRAEIRSLEAAVAASENQLDDATLRAPFDGEISICYVDNFQRVQAKQPIVRLFDVSEIEVTVQVPETLIGLVPQVKKVLCRFDAIPDREFVGKVTKVGREASQTTRTYPVTIEVPQSEDNKILPGMAAMVRNHATDEDAEGGDTKVAKSFIVPARSVFTADDSQTYVWIVGDGKVSRRAVKTGELTPVGIQILQGLEAGEQVVTAGVNSLREGQEVKLL